MANLTINGRTVTVDDSFLTLPREEQEATVEHIAESMPAKEASGAVAGAVHGMSELVNGPAETLKRVAGVGPGRVDDPNYVPANVTNGSWNPAKWSLSQLPQKVAEMAPSAVPDVAAGAAGAKLGKKLGGAKGAALGALLGATMSGFGRTAGDTIKEATANRTGNGNDESNAADITRGGLTAAASSLAGAALPTRLVPGMNPLRTVGAQGALDAAKKYMATTAIGGAGAVAQDATSQAGLTVGTDKGLTIDPTRFPEAAVGGAATGAALALPKGVADTIRAGNNREFGGENQAATENYATRLAQTGEGVGGLGNAKRDQVAHERVKTDITNELRDAARDVRKSTQLTPDVDNALQAAQDNKTITPHDLALIESGTAHTPDGANAAYLARTLRMAQLAQGKGTYSDKGWAGGISGAIEGNLGFLLNPLKIVGGGVATAMGQHVLGMGNPKFAAGVAGTYLGARALDGATGMRSPAKTFAEHFANQSAQLRIPKAAPQAPPQPPAAPTNTPWGPRPPMSGPTGPAVPPQAPPMAPQGPWGPRPLPTTSVPQMAAPSAPVMAPKLPWSAPQIGEQWKGPNPLALKMLAANLKQGLPPAPAPEAPKAPWQTPRVKEMWNAPKISDPAMPQLSDLVKPPQTEVGKDVLGKSKQLMNALATVQKLKAKTLALDEPAASNLGAAATPQGPQSMADVLRNVTADVTAPKKIKKANGKIEEAAAEEHTPYMPLDEEHLYPKGISPQAYAIGEAGKYGARSPVYIAKAQASAKARIEAEAQLVDQFPEFSHAIKSLVRQLHVVGTNATEKTKAVNHYAGLLHGDNAPAASAAMKKAFK